MSESENTGYGEFDYMNGDVYVGQWELFDKTKKRQGHGKFTHMIKSEAGNMTEEYQGLWENDKMHGYGTYRYLSGAIYQGEWFDGKQQGKGTYFFTNGAKYEGEWDNHKMNGTGVYTDPQGVEWEGIFINGTYDSTIQKKLKAEHEEKLKIEELKMIGLEQLAEFKKVFSLEKKFWKENFNRNLVIALEEVDQYVAEPYSRWEERNGEKWNDMLTQLLDVEPHVLRAPDEAELIPNQRVFATQLQGPGQVIEFYKKIEQRRIEIAIVMTNSGKWVIFHSVDVIQK